jgi:hypothetical protein
MRINQSCLDFDTMLQYDSYVLAFIYVDLPSGDCFLLPFLAVPFSFDFILFLLNPHLSSAFFSKGDLRIAHVFNAGITSSPLGTCSCMTPYTAVDPRRGLEHRSGGRSSFGFLG